MTGHDAPLLKTKLFLAPPRPNRVPRPRLVERLNAGLDRKLTLLSALPGSGKTTLLSEWAACSGRPVAWVSLDERDNDPARFLAYLVAALQTVEGGLGEGVLAALQSPHPPVPEAILAALLNEMAAVQSPLALVLDDYYVISAPPVHNAVRFVLEHLPPRVHLVISTRTDPPLPLSRLRARGEMTEIRTADLRFSVDEAAELLNRCLGLGLTGEDVAALEKRTEGWAVGLQLAGLSLQQQTPADQHGFVTAFAGDDRYVVDYLLEEVLRRQVEPIQSFLLHTSILERLSGPLCDAVTGRGDGQETLEGLERANLFLIPLDAKRHWYRYHHLFCDLLRQRLAQAEPDQAAFLHRRASEWYQQHGLAAEAIAHALSAGDHERVAWLIESTAWAQLSRGEIATLLAWLQALPEALVSARPRLGLVYAWALMGSMQFQVIEERLRDVERCVAATPVSGPHEAVERETETAAILGEVAALRATVASMQGDLHAAVQLSREALAGLPAEELRLRGVVANTLGAAHDAHGDVQEAAEAFAEAAELGQAAGNLVVSLIALGNLCRAQQEHGRLHEAAQTCRRALHLAAEQGGAMSPAVGMAHVGLGGLYYEWNDLAAAKGHLLEGIQLGRRSGISELVVAGYTVLVRVEQAQGQAAQALETLGEAERLVHGYQASVGLAGQVAASRAWLLAAQGNLEAAAHWVQEAGLAAGDELHPLRHAEYVALARLLVALGRLAEADKLLARLLHTAEAQKRVGEVVELLALQALSFGAQREHGRAMAALGQALALAEPEGYIRTFVAEGAPMAALLRQAGSRGLAPEYVGKLLQACATPPAAGAGAERLPGPGDALVEPLSERELEVLRLLAAGLSNQEIAQALVVTTGTAKWHVNNIYGKLGVHSRTQAILKARALGLLEPVLPRRRPA